MSGDSTRPWTEVEGARDHVKRLIADSGAPLEARLSRLCRRFANVWDETDGCQITTDTLVYGVDQNRPLREVDQLVTFYQEIPVSDRLGVQLILSAPIEAKARRHVEFFGLEVAGQAVGPGALPISGELAYSSFVRDQVAAQLPGYMEAQRIQRVAALKFKDAGSPQSVHDENLVYNATASLYDFVMESTALEGMSPQATVTANEADSLLSRIVDEFDQYVDSNQFLPELVARQWAQSVSDEQIREYVDIRTGSKAVFRMLDIYCPIVCVGSPLHRVELDGFGEITEFSPTDALTTAVRIAGWRSGQGRRLSRRGPEAVTSLMTLAGVEGALNDLLQLFASIKRSLEHVESAGADRAIFEHDFLASIGERLDKAATYRSDLDFGDM